MNHDEQPSAQDRRSPSTSGDPSQAGQGAYDEGGARTGATPGVGGSDLGGSTDAMSGASGDMAGMTGDTSSSGLSDDDGVGMGGDVDEEASGSNR
jgi:hypothetical protein